MDVLSYIRKIVKKIQSSRYQKLFPVGVLAVFLLGTLWYVFFAFKPSIDMSIDNQSVIHVRSRSEAEVEVYRKLPYKATFQLSTGEQFSLDMRYLGLSYFSNKELSRLDKISTKTFWDKFTPFLDTEENIPIAIYPNRMFWLKPLNQTLKNEGESDFLKQLPATNHLVKEGEDQLRIADKVNGYNIEPENFIKAAEEIAQTAKFENIPVESTVIEAEDQTALLGEYSHLVDQTEVVLPESYIQSQNMRTAYYKMQNIYIAAGETKSISDLLGELNASSGYLAMKDNDDKSIYGSGVEKIIDAIEPLVFSKMSVSSYKGQYFNVGQPKDGLTELTVQNNTSSDMVLSLGLEENRISIVLASK